MLAIAQESEVVMYVDVVFVFFTQQGTRSSCSGIGKQELQQVLVAVHAKNAKRSLLACPFDARNILPVARISFYSLVGSKCVDVDTYFAIGGPYFGIFKSYIFGIEVIVVVSHGKFGNLSLIEPIESNILPIG